MGNESNLEKMVTYSYLKKYFEGKKVFLTGHTGFKGSWLLQILEVLGAEVKGFALPPENDHDLYHLINGDQLCKSSILHDIRDASKLRYELLHYEPDFVFHMAAQPLVLESYKEPLYTFEVNAQGTANVLDALKHLQKKCVVVCITTDKVYENNDGHKAFKEDDKLGGYDPYSASKAAAEIIISSYRSSFFNPEHAHIHQKAIASVRAGNVIGGGDFATNRIIPDIVKAIKAGEEIILRNPHATRPWQHVIEPLGAYLLIATKMAEDAKKYSTAYNIGPNPQDVLSVEMLTQIAIQQAATGTYRIQEHTQKPHEASTLMLDISKVTQDTGWQPVYNAQKAIAKTMDWYFDTRNAATKCTEHIHEYFHWNE
ncbi:MAG: CDP-glucose 4,6-dehydratase [Bacteroidetes bacterium]|nr:CDP-glucose 4,6-dehydratase [Bacteroidota bacterium]